MMIAADRLGPLELDPRRDRVGEIAAGHAVRHAERVRVGHVAAARGQRLERLAQARDAGRAQRAQARAVVRDLAGDDLGLVRVPGELVVLPGELERRLDGLRAAAGEEHAVEVARGELGDPSGQLDRARVCVGPVRVEAELLGLVGAGLGDVGAAVADVDAEQGRQAVEVALAVLVVDVAALTARDDRDVRVLIGRHPGEVHPQMPLAQLLESAGAGGFLGTCHGSPRNWSVCRCGQR